MQVGIHQPLYLPWLGLFDRIYQCDLFILLDNVPYSKNYFLNRNKIRTKDSWIWLTIPVLFKGNTGILINDIKIDNRQDWRKKHWLSIYYSYRNSPHFNKYSEFFEGFYKKEWVYLAEATDCIFSYLLAELDIKTPIKMASSLDVRGKKEELILNICEHLKADNYLSGPDGRNYLHLDLWNEKHIKVQFHDYLHPQYPQPDGEFLSHLSVIDLLFNCGPESLNILISKK
ncbi:MAG: WbqC family protein [Syntrophobacterales bacterium]|nr:WbqC family protein [Syntrophobacterales bacterium]